MTYRLYAEYDTVAVRTARAYRELAKAVDVAKTINARFVYIRRRLPTGQEALVDVVMNHVT